VNSKIEVKQTPTKKRIRSEAADGGKGSLEELKEKRIKTGEYTKSIFDFFNRK